jgi:hypothetical protein
MGTEKPLMAHLTQVYDALEDGGPAVPALFPTPGDFAGGTPNHKLLLAAVGYVDAVLSEAQGTDPDKARGLVARVFEIQVKEGHGSIGANEILTPSHSQLWWAGMAAIYYAAVEKDDGKTARMAKRWFRAEAALCHLCGWLDNGVFKVISPGARGASPKKPELTTNPARNLGYHLLVTGTPPIPDKRKVWRDKYNLGPRLLLRLLRKGKLDGLREPGAGKPLAGPGSVQIWSNQDLPHLVDPLHVERSGGNHAASFEVLHALEPQWAAGVTDGEPWFIPWDGKDETKNGGPCPVPIPRLDSPENTVEVKPRPPV